jgi:hypothetical protein
VGSQSRFIAIGDPLEVGRGTSCNFQLEATRRNLPLRRATSPAARTSSAFTLKGEKFPLESADTLNIQYCSVCVVNIGGSYAIYL